MRWAYENIPQEEFETAIELAEQMVQSFGAVDLGEQSGQKNCLLENRESISEEIKQKVFQYGDHYIRVDRVYFPEKPFVVLEFGKELSGPYEDADPFPFDLERDAFEQEIRYSMGIEPYPEN